jgi:DNA-directed RNA polymerase subunit D
MKIEILEKTDTEIKFRVSDIKTSFASALRRIMISEIPTMAIEWVDFKMNSSALNDEIIANRLGQIPLVFDRKGYNFIDSCKCNGKGCTRCQVKFTLKKSGPGMVYSGDLKTRAKDVKPLYDNIPIVELFEDQEIELEAIAQLGYGKEHAKWQGAVVGYRQENGSFIFNVETASGLKPEEVVIAALEVLENKIKDFGKIIKKIK